MALDGCGKFLKYSIFIVNLLIFVIGIVILGLGIWAVTDSAEMNKVLEDTTLSSASIVLLSFGGAVAFISFLGCCGAIKEVKCLLLTFFIILLLISIAIVVGVVYAFKIKDEVTDAFDKGLLETMAKYDQDENIKKAWDEIQTKMKCCGAIEYADWKRSIPESCNCDEDVENCGSRSPGEPKHWIKGCSKKIKEEIVRHATPLLAVGIVIVLIIILAMVFSCTLFLML